MPTAGEYSIWATNPRKVPRKHTPDLLSRFPKSSFGRHKSAYTLCIPNEDFGKRNSVSGVRFRCTLRGFVAQSEYSHPRKVPRKRTPDTLFRFPKSSLGRHEMSYNVFAVAEFCYSTHLYSTRNFLTGTNQASAVRRPLLLDNLHFEHVVQYFNRGL